MTDEERGNANEAEETFPPVPSSPPPPDNQTEEASPPVPSSPQPPPPDVSMFDEAIASADLLGLDDRDLVVREKELSDPGQFASEHDDEEEEELLPLDASDALNEEYNRSSEPDLEPSSGRRPRITLKIPDDDVPLSSPPPIVETKPEKLVGPEAVVQAMRIIAIGELIAPSDDSIEQLEPSDQIDQEPLGIGDMDPNEHPSSVDAERVVRPDLDNELPSEEIEPIDDTELNAESGSAKPFRVPLPSSKPHPAEDLDEPEDELEPEEDVEDVEEPEEDTPLPVTVLDRSMRVEVPSPSPPLTAPLSPSASAPPPPTRTATRSAPDLSPLPLPPEGLRLDWAQPPVSGKSQVLELVDDEIAPDSVDVPLEEEDDVPPLPRPAQPPTGALENNGLPIPGLPADHSSPEDQPSPPAPEVQPSPPAPEAADITQPSPPAPEIQPPVVDAIASPVFQPTEPAPEPTPPAPPIRPPPPPRKREKRPENSDDYRRPARKPRPGWEVVFSDEFVRAYPRLNASQLKAEVNFIEKSLSIERGGVVLDLGCGAGQHAVELAARGYNVVGYDLSLTMLAMAADEAQERGQKINFLQGDMREMAFEEMFDGVYSWATSFGFFDEEKNISVIQRVHRSLRKGGLFLLDLINRDYVCARLPSLAWFEGDGCVCIDDAQFNAITSRLRVKRTIMVEDGTSREAEYTVRLYSLHEIGKILHDTGFKVVEVSGHPATAGAFFDAESPRVIALAVRR